MTCPSRGKRESNMATHCLVKFGKIEANFNDKISPLFMNHDIVKSEYFC